MTPLTLVCSLEVCKRLKEIGMDSGTALYWNEDLSTKFPVEMGMMADWMTKPYMPAFTLPELFLALPQMGEKLGWNIYGSHDVRGNNLRCHLCGERWDTEDVGCKKNFDPTWKRIAHRVLDAFLEGGMPAVDKEMLRLSGDVK